MKHEDLMQELDEVPDVKEFANFLTGEEVVHLPVLAIAKWQMLQTL
jgi:hypothetical protein